MSICVIRHSGVLDEGDVTAALHQAPEGPGVGIEGLIRPPLAVGVLPAPAEATEGVDVVAVGVILRGFGPRGTGTPGEEFGDGVDVVTVTWVDEASLQEGGDGHLPA